ncbi:MAG: MFS transporter [Pseudomonadota bacterium]
MDRNLNLLMVAVGVVGANSLVLAPVSPAVGAALDRTPAEIMQAAAAFGLATAASALLLAPLIDRIGAARMLRLALIGLATALAASGLAGSFATLAAAQALAGLASGIALPAAYALAADLAPPGRAAQALGRVITGWTLALVFGVTLSAVLADLVHWRAVFALTAATAAILALAIAGLPNHGGQPVTAPWTALPLPGVARALAAQLALMLSFYGTYSFLGAQLDAIGQGTLEAALPVLAYGIAFGLSGRLDGWLDRRGYGGAAPWVYTADAAILLLIAVLSGTLWGLAIAFALWGVTKHLGLNLMVARVTAAGGARKGAVLGLNSAVTYLAVVGGTVGFRPLFEAGGLAACAALGAVLCAGLAAEALIRRGSPHADPV